VCALLTGKVAGAAPGGPRGDRGPEPAPVRAQRCLHRQHEGKCVCAHGPWAGECRLWV